MNKSIKKISSISSTNIISLDKVHDLKPGHLEIHGETIAKFELFENGFNPYSRYLDIDKVDLIVRYRYNNEVMFKDIQVKYGRLYDRLTKNQSLHFKYTSWRIVDENEFLHDKYSHLFIIYVLVHLSGYNGDIFIFPIDFYNSMLRQAIKTNTKNGIKRKIYFSEHHDGRWFAWKKENFKGIISISDIDAIDITKYRRNFVIIKEY